MAIDLNALRSTVISNQKNGQPLPSDPNRQVVVDKEGRVLMGVDVRPGEMTTHVPQETFALKG